MQKLLISIFFCFLPFFAIAQGDNVPGYLGKKAFLDYNVSPTIRAAFTTGSISLIHNINFSYVVKRRAHIGLSYDFYSSSGKDNNNSFSKEESKIKGSAIGFNFDWYKKGNIAPVGRYWRAEAKYIFGNYTESDESWNPNTNNTEIVEAKGDFSHYYIGLGLGYRRIIADIFVFNVSTTIGPVIGTGLSANGYKVVLGSNYSWRVGLGLGLLLF